MGEVDHCENGELTFYNMYKRGEIGDQSSSQGTHLKYAISEFRKATVSSKRNNVSPNAILDHIISEQEGLFSLDIISQEESHLVHGVFQRWLMVQSIRKYFESIGALADCSSEKIIEFFPELHLSEEHVQSMDSIDFQGFKRINEQIQTLLGQNTVPLSDKTFEDIQERIEDIFENLNKDVSYGNRNIDHPQSHIFVKFYLFLINRSIKKKTLKAEESLDLILDTVEDHVQEIIDGNVAVLDMELEELLPFYKEVLPRLIQMFQANAFNEVKKAKDLIKKLVSLKNESYTLPSKEYAQTVQAQLSEKIEGLLQLVNEWGTHGYTLECLLKAIEKKVDTFENEITSFRAVESFESKLDGLLVRSDEYTETSRSILEVQKKAILETKNVLLGNMNVGQILLDLHQRPTVLSDRQLSAHITSLSLEQSTVEKRDVHENKTQSEKAHEDAIESLRTYTLSTDEVEYVERESLLNVVEILLEEDMNVLLETLDNKIKNIDLEKFYTIEDVWQFFPEKFSEFFSPWIDPSHVAQLFEENKLQEYYEHRRDEFIKNTTKDPHTEKDTSVISGPTIKNHAKKFREHLKNIY